MNPQLMELLEIYQIKHGGDFRKLIFTCEECGYEANYSRLNGILTGGCRCEVGSPAENLNN